MDIMQFANSLRSSPEQCVVLVDCTASDAVPDKYLDIMQSGCHIVAPNKKFGAGKARQALCRMALGRSF